MATAATVEVEPEGNAAFPLPVAAAFMPPPVLKIRSLMRKMLQTDTEFQDKMRVYLLKTQGTSTFYDNRLHFHFDTDGALWGFVTWSWQCSCCGQILASIVDNNCKLLSCAICKVVHYCDRACQKSDWKNGHKSVYCRTEGKQGIEGVLHICVRALSLMKFSESEIDGSEYITWMSQDVLSSLILQKTDPRSKKYVELATDENPTGKDRVCKHFRKKKESNRILFPIWEVATDNLSFVPISLHFLSNGLGVTDDLVKSFETKMSTNDNMYFVVVMGMVKGKLAVTGGRSFIAISDIPCSSGASADSEGGGSSSVSVGGAAGSAAGGAECGAAGA